MASDNITTDDLNVPDLGEMINTRASLAAAFDRNPDQAAQARQLSQQIGSPMTAVEDNLTEVSNLKKLDEYSKMLQNAPKTRAFFTRPDNAAVAHDNLPNMHAIERTFLDRERDILASDLPPLNKIGRMFQEVLPDALQRGWYLGKQGSSNVLHALGAFDNLQRQQDLARTQNGLPPQGAAARADYLATLQRESERYPMSDEVEQTMQSVQASQDFSTAAGVFMRHPSALGDLILQSLGTSAPALAMTLGGTALGGPVGGAGAAFAGSLATEFGNSITSYLGDHKIDISDRVAVAKALDDKDFMAKARDYSLERGIPVAAFDALATFLGGRLLTGAKSTKIKDLAPRVAAEPLIQAGSGAMGEQTAQWITGENKPGDVVAEALAEMPTAAIDVYGNFLHAKRYGQQAEADTKRVETLNALAKADKVLQRDPALFEQFAKDASEDGPTNQVFVTAGALMQSGNANELMAVSPAIASQLPAKQTDPNALIAIPSDEYLAKIAPTDYAQALAPHIKFDPEGYTFAEAEDFKKNHLDELTQEFSRAIGNAAQDEAFQASHDRLEQKFRQELNAVQWNKGTDAVNGAYAKMLAAYFSVLASKRGVSPEELHNDYAIKFARGEMAQGQSYDQEGRLQTDTEAFRNWFGDSKVVDAEGKPLVVHHGSPDVGFTEFHTGNNIATFFSTRFDVAASYAGRYNETEIDKGEITADDGQGVYDVYLKLDNPKVVDFKGRLWFDGPDGLRSDDILATAKREGFDGVIFTNIKDVGDLAPGLVEDDGVGDVYAVFSPTQIKSAIGNNGNFDPNDPNILHQSANEEDEGESVDYGPDYDALTPEVREVVDEVIDSLPDPEGLRAKLVELKGTPWAKQAIAGMALRDSIIHVMNGKDARIPSLLDKQSLAPLKSALQGGGIEAVFDYLERNSMIGNASKPESSVASSYASCRPTGPCASYCYAVNGERYPATMAKAELNTLAVELDPTRAAELTANDWESRTNFMMGGALRMFDRGDGDARWIPYLNALAEKGVRTHIFSKRPEFLAEVTDLHLRLLSMDTDNQHLIDSVPEGVSVAYVFTGTQAEIDFMAKHEDKIGLALPVKFANGFVPIDQIKALSKAIGGNKICPVDKGVVTIASAYEVRLPDGTRKLFDPKKAKTRKGESALVAAHREALAFKEKNPGSKIRNEGGYALVDPNGNYLGHFTEKGLTRAEKMAAKIGGKIIEVNGWNCINCDQGAGIGCYVNSTTAKAKEQVINISSITGRKLEREAERSIADLESRTGIRFPDDARQRLLDELVSGLRQAQRGNDLRPEGDGVSKTEGGVGSPVSSGTTTESAPGKGGKLYQSGSEESRGAFSPETLTIAFLKDADYSTFLHESGHFFLEMHFDMASKLQKMADDLGADALTPGEQEILRDVQTVLDWFEIPDLNTWYSLDLEQKRPYHERFARGFERYTMEGKAPSIELQSVFRNFKAWLLKVYKTITAFKDVELTDEVRGVFDRMLASEEQIHLMQQARSMLPLLTSIDHAPMAVEDFERYHKKYNEATDVAVETFTAWALKDLKWLRNARSRALKELQRDARDTRKDVRMQVKAEVMSQPIYRAWTLLTGKIKPQDQLPVLAVRKGNPDQVEPEYDNLATAIAKLGGLNKDEVIAEWGIDPKENPKSGVFRKYVFRRNGAGHSRESMAEMLMELGYLSRDEHGKHSLWEFEEKFDNQLRGMNQYSTQHQPELHLRQGDQVYNPFALDAVRFSTNDLRSMIDSSLTQELQKRRMTSEKSGMHPDIVRDLIMDQDGNPAFSSGEALAIALANATPPDEAIEALTDVRMLEEYGDLATPEAIEQGADLAVHNKAMIKFATHQANVLAEAVGKRRVLEASARELAEHEVGRTRIRYLRPSRYTSVEARAAKSAAQYLKANDIANAAAETRNQVFNMLAAKSALEAQAEIRKIDQFFKRIVSGKDDVIGKTRDMDIVNAARAVLYRFGYGHKARKADEYLKAVEKYDPELFLTLQQVVLEADALAATLSAKGPITIRDLTVNELRELNGEIEVLWYQAKRGKQVEIDGKLVNREEVEERLSDQADSLDRARVEYGRAHAITPEEELALHLASAKSTATRVEHWVDVMDNGEKMGAFRYYVFNRIKDAADAFRAANTTTLKQYRALYDSVADSFKTELIDAPELGYTFGHAEGGVAMNEILHAIAHTGNDSNKRKMLLGRGWAKERADGSLDTTRWDAFIARLIQEGKLTKSHYDFAQGIWDLMESTKPLAQKAHREAYGRYFSEITANAFQTPWGEYRGGYIPATVDSRLVTDLELKKLIEEGKDGMAYAFPGTSKGFTMGRVEYNKPLMLDLRTLSQHINKVLLFSHMEMPVRDTTRILASKRVRRAIDPIDPAAINTMLLPWLNRSARQQVTTPMAGMKWANNFANMIRGRTVLSTMFFNVTNAAQQVTGFFPAALKVNPGLLADAMAQYVQDPRKLTDEIAQLSPFMAHRMENEISAMMDDINDILLNPTLMQKMQEWSKRHAFFLQSAVDNVMSPIIWHAAFNQALAEDFDVKNAARIADSVVRTTQGSSLPEDVSRFESGPAWARVLTLFSGWFLNLAGLMGAELGKIMQQGGLRKNMGRAFMVFILVYYAQAVVAEAISQAMRGGPDDDDKDGSYLDDWLMAVFVYGPIRTATAAVPVLGPAINSTVARFNSNPNDDRISVSPVVNAIETVGAVPHDLYQFTQGKGNARQTIRDVGTMITMGTGIAVTPVTKTLGYAGGVAQGKIQPTGPIDLTRGLISGAPSPESKQR